MFQILRISIVITVLIGHYHVYSNVYWVHQCVSSIALSLDPKPPRGIQFKTIRWLPTNQKAQKNIFQYEIHQLSILFKMPH